MIVTDYLIIGSGIAGLSCALKLSNSGSVALVTKRGITDSATNYAQGGIAAVWDPSDSFERHIQDTLAAGAGLCNKEIVEIVVKEGPGRIKELIDWGVHFTLSATTMDQEFELGLEGGHSHRRILHAEDMTGNEIEKALARKTLAQPGVTVYDQHIAVDLITTGKIERCFQGEKERCWGAYVLDIKNKKVETFLARAVILASGGAGKVYLYTSNPDIATGDGVAMAYRCGATIANMEFVQFHPTCLYHPKAKSFLISEALRGEGGILRLKNGDAFMEKYHPMKDLAPRDVVARAIDNELKVSGDDNAFLDMTHCPPDFLKKRFPGIYRTCLEFGIDMTKVPLPVVPAAHYSCGGVLTNQHGESSIARLYAVGEVACSGLHGANRLASNSLLEAVVFADRIAQKAREHAHSQEQFPQVKAWDTGSATDSSESVVVTQNWEEIRHFMWNYVGIVRSNKRLARAERRIELLQQEIVEYYWNFIVTSDLVELRNIATVAELIIRSAMKRKESRGLHYTIDYPQADAESRSTLMNRFVAL